MPPALDYKAVELAPPPRPSRFSPPVVVALVVVAVFIVIIIVAVATVENSINNFPGSSSNSGLKITGLNVQSPDNACGLNGDDSGTYQTGGSTGGVYQTPPTVTWGLPGPGGSLPCTVTNVSTTTPGFELVASLPETATSFPSVLVVSIIVGPSSYDGVLEVTFS